MVKGGWQQYTQVSEETGAAMIALLCLGRENMHLPICAKTFGVNANQLCIASTLFVTSMRQNNMGPVVTTHPPPFDLGCTISWKRNFGSADGIARCDRVGHKWRRPTGRPPCCFTAHTVIFRSFPPRGGNIVQMSLFSAMRRRATWNIFSRSFELHF